MSYYPLTECSICRDRSTNQLPGNICHRCLVGFMRVVTA